jgi:penicillin amidase
MAWGVTILFGDTSEMYEEKIEGDKYLYKDKWLPLRVIEETVIVKGEAAEVVTVHETIHGPVISGFKDRISNVLENRFPVIPDGFVSFKWTGYKPTDNQYSKSLEALTCITIECAIDKVREMDGINLNIVLADSKGNIAYAPAGTFPKRARVDIGQHVSQGWTGEDEWDGYLDASEKPYSLNPKKGYIASANNRISSKNVEFSIATNIVTTPRAIRIDELMLELITQKSGSITLEDVNKILHDTIDVYATHKTKKLISIATKNMSHKKRENHGRLEALLGRLAKWNGDFDQKLEEPTILSLWEYYFMEQFAKQQIPDDEIRLNIYDLHVVEDFIYNFLTDLDNDNNLYSKFCAGETQTCADQVVSALMKTDEFLNNRTT